MLRMSEDEFRRTVREALDSFPEDIRAKTRNLAVTVRDEPTDEELRSVGLDPEQDTLFGLYDGLSQTEQSPVSPDLFPAKITVFRLPLLEECSDRTDLLEEIRLTVLHEMGHHFGLSDEDLP
jgi:predicted Zn-dependent protease with MMP-like domain